MPEDIELTRRGDDSRQSMGVGAGANDTSLSSGFKEQPGTGKFPGNYLKRVICLFLSDLLLMLDPLFTE